MVEYQKYQICFTLVLLFIPYVFFKCSLICLTIYVTLKFIQKLWKRFSDKRINPVNRGVFITGCDSGFGFAFAKRLHELEFSVLAGCLNTESDGAKKLLELRSDRLHVIKVDVADDVSVEEAFLQVQAHLPDEGLWAIINNAGINSFGDIELTPVSLYEKLLNVNLFGPLRIIRQFLQLIRKSKGRVINITSVHGRMALPEQSNYEVAKHGIETMTDSLRLEMQKFDVKVCIIEPGKFGRCTSIQNKSVIQRQTKEIEDMWNASSPQMRETYSKQYLLSWLPTSNETWPPNDGDISNILQAVEDAVCSSMPQSRYLIDGYGKHVSFIDEYGLLARIHNILPTWMTDICAGLVKDCYKKVK
ncbi:hypothetical protein ACF0H5_003652 [Mactra antiquata]